MTTTQQAIANLTNDTLTSVHYSNASGPALRDSNGNLREITDAESAFCREVRTEMKRRGLL